MTTSNMKWFVHSEFLRVAWDKDGQDGLVGEVLALQA